MEPLTVFRVSDCPHNKLHNPDFIGKMYERHPIGLVCITVELQKGQRVISSDKETILELTDNGLVPIPVE